MSAPGPSSGLFRPKLANVHHRVTYAELFYDLVFVFAITQLSHTLLHDLSWHGLLEVGVLTAATWWVWVFTSWITNWLHPDATPVRLMLFVMMLAGLAFSTSIPEAFHARGLVLALAYVAMQLGRTIFMICAIPREDRPLRLNFQRILAWLLVSGVFWIAGGLAHGPSRIALFGVALAIEYVGPAARFRTPGLGASDVADWSIEGAHLAERCALFLIIALGESILVTGSTFASSPWNHETIVGFLEAFLGSLAAWWIYFDTGVEVGAHRIAHAEDPGRLARLAYTYLHLPIVAGIILAAVSDEIVLQEPHGHVHGIAALCLVGGPLLFLFGMLLFKRAVRGIFQLSHLVGIAALAILAFFASRSTPLVVASCATLVLVTVAIWESISLGRKTA